MTRRGEEPSSVSWRHHLYSVIFEAETKAGKAFDVLLLISIIASVGAVLLDSVASIRDRFGEGLRVLEWGFTFLFTAEYLVRLASVRRPLRYATSFFGIVDLAAVIPTYLSLVLVNTQSLIVIRAFRLLRIFRVFKLARYLGEANVLMIALRSSLPKITVFLGTVLSIVLVAGALMYLIEGAESGFTSIPRGMYWAIVTMTTVGYGDIAPTSVVGQLFAAILMIMGYGIIAVPTGIVSAELVRTPRAHTNTRTCPHCLTEGHARRSQFCRDCGAKLNESDAG